MKVIFNIIQYYKSNKNYNKCVIVTHRNFISRITKIKEEDIQNLCFIEYKYNLSYHYKQIDVIKHKNIVMYNKISKMNINST